MCLGLWFLFMSHSDPSYYLLQGVVVTFSSNSWWMNVFPKLSKYFFKDNTCMKGDRLVITFNHNATLCQLSETLLSLPLLYLATRQPTTNRVYWLLTLVSFRFDYGCESEKSWKQLGSPHQRDRQGAPDCPQGSTVLHRGAVLWDSASDTPPGAASAPRWAQPWV